MSKSSGWSPAKARSIPRIPDKEFAERLSKAQVLIRQRKLDVLIVNSTEADLANVRYFADYWPIFEIAGVAISPNGEAALMIGPESENFARDRSKIDKIHKLVEYRESADPQYPGLPVSTFADVFADIGVKHPKRIGIGGYLVTTAPVLDSLRQTYPKAELVRADSVMIALRSIKSKAELACHRKAFELTAMATDEVIRTIRPGMTELQVVGIAQQVIYENGAEYEGLPEYVMSGPNTRHAISRPSYRVMKKGDMVQLNLSARIAGYSSSIGVPFCLGRMTPKMKDLVAFGLEAHHKTREWLKAGVVASDVARQFKRFVFDRGHASHYLYGPCHGLGMIEVEPPWMEESSDYQLQPNMTFQIDTFLCGDRFGCRWENGGYITQQGFELFSPELKKIIELV